MRNRNHLELFWHPFREYYLVRVKSGCISFPIVVPYLSDFIKNFKMIWELLSSNDSESISLGIKMLSQTDFLEWCAIHHKVLIYDYCLGRILYGVKYKLNTITGTLEFDDFHPTYKINYHVIKLKSLSELCYKYENFRNASSPDIETVNLGIKALKALNFKFWISKNMFQLSVGASKDGYRLALLAEQNKEVRFLLDLYWKNRSNFIMNDEMDIPLSIEDCVEAVKKFEDENIVNDCFK